MVNPTPSHSYSSLGHAAPLQMAPRASKQASSPPRTHFDVAAKAEETPEVQQLRKQVQELAARLIESEAQAGKIRAESIPLTEVELLKRERASIEDQVGVLTHQLEGSDQFILDLQQALSNLGKEKDKLESDLSLSKAEAIQLQTDLRNSNLNVQYLRRQFNSAVEGRHRAETQLEASRAQLGAAKNDLQLHIDLVRLHMNAAAQLQIQLAEANAEILRLSTPIVAAAAIGQHRF